MNEFQAAYELSRIEYVSNDETNKLNELAEAGKFPVYVEDEIHCTFTDAMIAREFIMIEAFDTIEAAEAYCDENNDPEFEPYYNVWTLPEPEPTIEYTDDNCPF